MMPDTGAVSTVTRSPDQGAGVDAAGLWVGQSMPRVEDGYLLTGRGSFTADYEPPGTLHLAIVRSEVASATIEDIDVSPALGVPGVRAVITAAELTAVEPLRGPVSHEAFLTSEGPR